MRNPTDMPRRSGSSVDGCLAAFGVVWLIGALLTIAFWGVVAFAAFQFATNQAPNCFNELGAQVECPR